MTSGRLTPAAATRTSTSRSPGCGTGLLLGFSCSGPPGAAISITVISSGTDMGLLLLPTVASFDAMARPIMLNLIPSEELSRRFAVLFYTEAWAGPWENRPAETRNFIVQGDGLCLR